MVEVGDDMRDHTNCMTAGVTATIANGTLTLTAQRDTVVPVTGARVIDPRDQKNKPHSRGAAVTFVRVPKGKQVRLRIQ
ncbi:MAG TPA: hypothetical protein VK420_11325, partial [Longimicrobium sp.]|nr:hypothetical protein [Longimicrobium sp.]